MQHFGKISFRNIRHPARAALSKDPGFSITPQENQHSEISNQQ